jgi:N-acetylglucosamine-6-sulfatase
MGKRFLFSGVCALCLCGLVPAARAAKPNIIFILADDFSWNLVDKISMPNLVQMQADGTTFYKHFVTDSLCCPSRSSIFTGKFPHNTGVFTNNQNTTDGGYGAFKAHGNETQTFGAALKAGGYQTAMLGKYLNGYAPDQPIPPAGQPVDKKSWTEWYVAGEGYPEFNYDLRQGTPASSTVVHHSIGADDYLTDVIRDFAITFIKKFEPPHTVQPFFVEIATFAPHSPYRPAYRNETDFLNILLPQTPPYAHHALSPVWLSKIPALTSAEMAAFNDVFRLRMQSVEAIDEVIGRIRKALKTANDTNTYIFFSSDNGYHIGEYNLHPGKQTAFDTDINVPLVVVGPNVPANQRVDAITMSIDLCPTFVEIAGLASAPKLPTKSDGTSLLPFIKPGPPPTSWRQVALIEHHNPEYDMTDPDRSVKGEDPPTYFALRTSHSTYVEYDTGEKSYYDLVADPLELTDAYNTLSKADKDKLANILRKNKDCVGAAECWNAGTMVPP